MTGFGVDGSGQLQAYNPYQAGPLSPSRGLSPFKGSKKTLLGSPGQSYSDGAGGGFVSAAL